MKRATITIEPGGIVSIDLNEGFSGTSCTKRMDKIAVLIGGEVESERLKDSYYDSDPEDAVEVLNSLGL